MSTATGESTAVTAAGGETEVRSGAGRFYGVLVETNKTVDVSVLVEDGTSEMFTFLVVGTEDGKLFSLPVPVKFTNGLNVTVTGTGATAFVIHGT